VFKKNESGRRMGEWNYTAARITVGTNEGSSQLHVPAILPEDSKPIIPTEWESQMGPTADENVVEKETSLPLSEIETRFSGSPFRRLVALLSVLSLFISKLGNRQTHTVLRKSKIGRMEHIFYNALFVTLHTVRSKSCYLQTDQPYAHITAQNTECV
jgi:hypothetical protein